MSKYSGLDKADISDLIFVETYRGVKIYKEEGALTFTVVSRKYLVDEGWTTLEFARECVDHFKEA